MRLVLFHGPATLHGDTDPHPPQLLDLDDGLVDVLVPRDEVRAQVEGEALRDEDVR